MEQNQKDMIGEQLIEIRTTLGLSQHEVADAANVSQGYLSRLERNQFCPTLPIVLRLAKALRVPVERLIQTEQSKNDRRCG